MKNFSKQEIVGLLIIFLILIGVSWPNFALSLRRARDQIRRDDIGNIQAAIGAYYSDYGIYPASTEDGKIIACKDPSEDSSKPTFDVNGNPEIKLVPCNWGRDTWINLTPGVNKTYLKVIPGDPEYDKGISYAYFSDGSRYQLMGSLESSDEPGYDEKLFERSVSCGARTCNMGRNQNVPLYISIEEYNLQIHCATYPKDLKCINRQ